MRKLLNVLYVTLPDAFLSLDGENVVVRNENETLLRVPIHNLEGIVTFGYTGASPALMRKCAECGVALTFCSPSGRFLADVRGEVQGNVLLRRTQYRVADCSVAGLAIAKNMLIGKLHNGRWVLERATRDYAMRLDVERIKHMATLIAESINKIETAKSVESLIGIEGEAASIYFAVFDELILQNKSDFQFNDRNRRPPTDNVNAMLSFVYTLLSHDCAAALSAVGLDPFVGYLHKDRPGRRSLALDLMEELRAPLADRFVLTMINNRQVSKSDFDQMENGAVLMKDDTRKAILKAWQERKQEQITHPFLREKIQWGLVCHVQALLLARHLRGDLDEYPPFLWK